MADPKPRRPPSDDRRRRPRWPKVVGVASLIVAAVALTLDALYVLMPLWENMLKDDIGNAVLPPFMQVGPGSVWLRVFVLLTNALLVLAGILTLTRRRPGRRLHVVYAVLALIATIAGTVYAIRIHGATEEWMRKYPDNFLAEWYAGFDGSIFPGLALAAGIILALAWPVFCFAWFAVQRREPDEGLARA